MTATILQFPAKTAPGVSLFQGGAPLHRYPPIEEAHREVYFHRNGTVYAERRIGDIEALDRKGIGDHLLRLAQALELTKGDEPLFSRIYREVRQLITAREAALLYKELFKIEVQS